MEKNSELFAHSSQGEHNAPPSLRLSVGCIWRLHPHDLMLPDRPHLLTLSHRGSG